jgi:hypothetical protein
LKHKGHKEHKGRQRRSKDKKPWAVVHEEIEIKPSSLPLVALWPWWPLCFQIDSPMAAIRAGFSPLLQEVRA